MGQFGAVRSWSGWLFIPVEGEKEDKRESERT